MRQPPHKSSWVVTFPLGRIAAINIAVDDAPDPKQAIELAKLDHDYELFKNDINGSPFATLVSQS